MSEFFQSNTWIYGWVIIPLLIFLARVADVTLGTMRVYFVSRGYRFAAAFIGFWEILIWLTAIGCAMRNLSNLMAVVAFAMGFAAGNYIGIWLTQKLSLGVVLVQILTNENTENLMRSLKEANYGVTRVEGRGAFGPMQVIFTIVQRQSVPNVARIIQANHPTAFYTIEEICSVNHGKLLQPGYSERLASPRTLQLLRPFRKGK